MAPEEETNPESPLVNTCAVCKCQVWGRCVRLDLPDCEEHLCHNECMERKGNVYRNPETGPTRSGYQCPVCQATSDDLAEGIILPESTGPLVGETDDGSGTDRESGEADDASSVKSDESSSDALIRAIAGIRTEFTWIPMKIYDSIPAPPPSAVYAGTENGHLVFVARHRLQKDVIPGKLVPGLKSAFFPWGGKEHKSRECEVLTSSRNRFRWVPSSEGEMIPNAIVGGRTEYDETLYIGRKVNDDGTVQCGKIHPSHKVLYVPFGGKELGFKKYEILVAVN